MSPVPSRIPVAFNKVIDCLGTINVRWHLRYVLSVCCTDVTATFSEIIYEGPASDRPGRYPCAAKSWCDLLGMRS
jgi:hypothetical protein